MKKVLLLATPLLWLNQSFGQCTDPVSVTATPSVICAGATTSLNATAAGLSINWYTVGVGGVPIGTCASGANYSVSPVMTTTYYAESFQPAVPSVTFNYTGSLQYYTVPAGVTQLTIEAKGAQGGNSPANTALGGNGARIIGTFPVSPGQVLSILVGQQGLTKPNDGGTNYGGGGGGGSFVWTSSVNPMVAAGGGGGAHQNTAGGMGLTTTSGGNSNNGATGGSGGNGGGATGACGAAGGGGWFTAGANSSCINYAPQLQGGGTYSTFVAGLCTSPCSAGGANYGTNGGYGGGGAVWHAGGGGGGYSGGGGGNNSAGNGGGGGSYNGGANQSNTAGFQTGNGQVIITGPAGCISAQRIPVTVTVNALPVVTVNSGSICIGGSFSINPSGANTYTVEGGNIVVSPTVNTNYTVVGTSTAGCVSQVVTSSITVNATPVPTISVSGGSICSGQSFTLNPSGANTYTIQGGNAVVSPTTNTSYTVAGTNSVGCVSNTFAVANITVNALPTVSVAGTSTICKGSTASFTASGANTYSWNTGASTATLAQSPTVTTNYTVTGTSAAGCSSTYTFALLVDPCTGLNQFAVQGFKLDVYPNPTSGEITIDLNNGKEKLIEITDYTGKVVYIGKTDKDQVKVNMSGFSNGIYQVKVQSANTSEVLKVVKQ